MLVRDQLPVDQNPVAAPQILDEDLVFLVDDQTRVLPRNAQILENDIAQVGVFAKDVGRAPLQGELRAAVGPRDHLEEPAHIAARLHAHRREIFFLFDHFRSPVRELSSGSALRAVFSEKRKNVLPICRMSPSRAGPAR